MYIKAICYCKYEELGNKSDFESNKIIFFEDNHLIKIYCSNALSARL
jgi:hypothetical protein